MRAVEVTLSQAALGRTGHKALSQLTQLQELHLTCTAAGVLLVQPWRAKRGLGTLGTSASPNCSPAFHLAEVMLAIKRHNANDVC